MVESSILLKRWQKSSNSFQLTDRETEYDPHAMDCLMAVKTKCGCLSVMWKPFKRATEGVKHKVACCGSVCRTLSEKAKAEMKAGQGSDRPEGRELLFQVMEMH